MAKVSPGEFIRQVWAETAKVVWPSRRETVATAIMVVSVYISTQREVEFGDEGAVPVVRTTA